MGGRLVQSIAAAASYQGSGGGGIHQYDTCNDQHRLGPAVNKMMEKKMGQALLHHPGSQGVWMPPELIRDMSGGSDMSGSGRKDLPVHVQEHTKGKCWL